MERNRCPLSAESAESRRAVSVPARSPSFNGAALGGSAESMLIPIPTPSVEMLQWGRARRERGKFGHPTPGSVITVASMGPRSEGARKVVSAITAVLSEKSFNGAALGGSAERWGNAGVGPSWALASMGPRSEGARKDTSNRRKTTRITKLQWGRARRERGKSGSGRQPPAALRLASMGPRSEGARKAAAHAVVSAVLNALQWGRARRERGKANGSSGSFGLRN